MFKITKEYIKPLATDESSYFRGLRYYKNSAVTNVTWSKATHMYRAIVKGGNQYTVTIELNEKEELKYTCNCPGHIKNQGACKHVIAALLFIEHYQERSEGKQPETDEEKTIFQILDYFSRQEGLRNYGGTYSIEVNISVPSMLKNQLTKAFVSISAGGSRLYKVQNIKKFLTALYNDEAITLGKEFQYLPGESRFSRESRKILDYFTEIYEIQEALGKVYYSNLFSKSEITFTKNMLIKLLKLVSNSEFSFELYNKHYEGVRVVTGNPPIRFDLEVLENRIKMDYHDQNMIIPIAWDGSILLYGNNIYMPDKAFITSYLPFYNNIGREKGPLYFAGEQKDKFLEVVLPKIYETMQVDIPSNLKDHFVQVPVKINVYLDKYKSYIKAGVMFQYGEYEINPLTGETPDDFIIVRDREKENSFLEYMEHYNFMPGKNGFLLKKEEDIFEFLTERVHQMAEHCTLYYSEDFRSLSIRNSGQMHSSVSVADENNLLDLSLSYDNIPKDELKELFRSLQVKKKYYRLKDGSFINLTEDILRQSAALLEQINYTPRDMDDGVIRLPSFTAPYLDYFLDQMDSTDYKKDASYQELVRRIKEPVTAEYLVPGSITAKLRSYQAVGYKWLRTLADNNLGGILADDMGLGKTLQSICYMTYYIEHDPEEKKHLVICPTSLVYNWQEEFNSFAPHIRTAVVSGTPEEREYVLNRLDETDVVITSYPLLRRDIENYEKILFHTVFLDEAQFIKNANSQNAKCVKRIVSGHRFALTGTPMENSLSELWSIFDFIMPSYLMSHNKFAEKYEKPIIKNGNKEVLEDLGRHIHPFILRRMKKEVLKELPEKVETKMLTEMTEQQRKVYLSYLQNIRADLFEEAAEKSMDKNRMQILAALTRLRQICCHPSTFIHNYKGGSGKLDVLVELTEKTLENGHRILIFSQFTSMLQLIEKELVRQNIDYFCLDGSTRTDDRNDFVRRFNSGERSVFLISLKAGGTGLNLTGADTVIHFDPWWNPAVEDQAADRAYRIGQKNSVQVIKLIAKDTIEEKIYKLQKKKKAISDSIIQSKEIFINHLTKEELEDIFRID